MRCSRDSIVDAQWADNGPGWVVVFLNSAETVLALEPARDQCIGREGSINVSQDEQGTIWIGGDTASLVEGRIDI